MSTIKPKQVIVIRRDLGMRRGKEIAQGAHASMAWLTRRIRYFDENDYAVPTSFHDTFSEAEKDWMTGLFAKVTCQVPGLDELNELHSRALKAGLEVHLIVDSGLTEFKGEPTPTALGIGPDWSDRVDEVTGHLKLY